MDLLDPPARFQPASPPAAAPGAPGPLKWCGWRMDASRVLLCAFCHWTQSLAINCGVTSESLCRREWVTWLRKFFDGVLKGPCVWDLALEVGRRVGGRSLHKNETTNFTYHKCSLAKCMQNASSWGQKKAKENLGQSFHLQPIFAAERHECCLA